VIWINGRPAEYLKTPRELQMFSEYAFGSRQAGCTSSQSPPLPNWDFQADGSPNTIRLGEVSDLGMGPFPRNQSADMTMDEFYLWHISEPFTRFENGVELGQANVIQDQVIDLRKSAVRQWAVGRYYRPQGDAVFTSAPIYMGLQDRSLAPPSSAKTSGLKDVVTGVPGGAPAAPKGPSDTVAGPPKGITAAAPQKRTALLGFSWTWHPEEVSRIDGHPISYDYRPKIPGQYGASDKYVQSDDDEVGGDRDDSASDAGYRGAGALDLAPSKSSFKWNPELDKLTPLFVKQKHPQCMITLRVLGPDGGVRRTIDSEDTRGFMDAGKSEPRDPATGRPHEISSDEALQYDVRFEIDGLQSDSILLGAPVFDDITFYFATEVEFLSWSMGDAAR